MYDNECVYGECHNPVVARRLCSKHYQRVRRSGRASRPSALERWSAKVDVGDISELRPDLGKCWLWNASKFATTGYGQFNSGTTITTAHRWGYQNIVGPIPAGLELDHLCRVRRCVNPEHLEPVTREENVRRGLASGPRLKSTTCSEGHPFDVENTYYYPNGDRLCRACRRKVKT